MAAQAGARAAGAKGLRIVGSIETGQELVQRFPVDDVFVGLTGNWLNQEMAVATGAIDVFAADMNCTVPTLAETCTAHGALLIPVSDLMGIPGAEPTIVFDPGQGGRAGAGAHRQGDRQLPAAGQPDGNGKPALRTGDAVAGFSTESILAALGGRLDPLLDVIKNGTLSGVAGLVSCTTLRDSGQDSNTVAVARELIKNDVLVLAMGCGNAAVQVAGLETPEAKELAGPGLKAVCELLGIPPVLSASAPAPTPAASCCWSAPSPTPSASTCRRCPSWQRPLSTWSRRQRSTPWRRWPSACTSTSTRCPS